MRKIIVVITAVPLFALVAAATDFAREEAFLGYNFVRFNPNSGNFPSFNANGGGGQFAYNFSRWFGVVADVGAVTNGTLNQTSVDTTVLNFLAGPRITFHNHSRFVPFAQVLFGGAYSTASTRISVLPGGAIAGGQFQSIVNSDLPISARLVASNTGFAMMAGGGLDIRINKHVAFRPIGADYYLTRLPNLFTSNLTGLPTNTSNRNNFRYSAGFNFMFGAR